MECYIFKWVYLRDVYAIMKLPFPGMHQCRASISGLGMSSQSNKCLFPLLHKKTHQFNLPQGTRKKSHCCSAAVTSCRCRVKPLGFFKFFCCLLLRTTQVQRPCLARKWTCLDYLEQISFVHSLQVTDGSIESIIHPMRFHADSSKNIDRTESI